MFRTPHISSVCPICNHILIPSGPQYTIDSLFALWKPTTFNPATVEEHRKQSEYTQIFSCPECKLDIFLPKIIGTSQFYTEAYSLDSAKDAPRIFTYSEEKWDFQEAISDLNSITSVIEIGCGNGSFLKKITEVVPVVVGIEYNNQAVLEAREKGLSVFGLSEEEKIKGEKFDVAISFHVLEHVEDPIQFMKKMYDYIKDSGMIILSVPNQEGPIKYIDPCIHNMPPHHATRWHKRTFEVLSEKLDLKIEKIAYEPLLLQNRDYYSYYWVNHAFAATNYYTRFLRKCMTVSLELFFRCLMITGLRYFPLLRGQSIYVVMRKRKV